jgi:ATP-dependent RNA helicase DeaD
MTFSELGLRSEILKAVEDLGFTEPTPIQSEAIPAIISGEADMVGLAQTGTGKTAAFGLPLLNLINDSISITQGIVICPTRELCMQITNDLKNYSKYMRNVNVVAVYGGASIQNQERDIKRGAQIIVATPGRMIDLINRRVIKLGEVKFVVLDEADEMLNMGFQEDIDDILSHTPKEKHVWLFSATMPKEVAQISRKYLNNPVELTMGKKNMSAENITHKYFAVKERDRYVALKRIIDFYPEIFGLIFCRTKRETQDIAEKLIKDGYNCESLHGDLSQAQRDMVMKKFRERTIQILCATDVAARGIDVNDITHVINYNLPDDVENYTHRSGRTARAGKKGYSLVLVNTRETGRIRDIERIISKSFEVGRIPGGEEICDKQLMALLDKISNAPVNEKEIAPYITSAMEKLESLTKEEVIKKFISTEFNRFLEYYRGAGDLNADARVSSNRESYESGGKQQRGRQHDADGEFQRFFLNIGASAGINKGALLRKICDLGNVSSNEVGRIDMKDEFSFIEVKTDVSKAIFESFQNQEWEGKRLRIEIAEKREGGSGGGGGYKGGGGGGGYKGGNRGGGSGSGGGGNRSRSYGGGGGAKKYSSNTNSSSHSSSDNANKGKSFGKDRGGFGKKKYSSSWD